MKTFAVPAGTVGMLVTETSSSPFTTRKELVFEREELVFDPVMYMHGSVDPQWSPMAEHGFAGFQRAGESGKPYMLIVRYVDIQIGAEE